MQELFISELAHKAEKATLANGVGYNQLGKVRLYYNNYTTFIIVYNAALSVQGSDKFQFLKDILPKKVLARIILETRTKQLPSH